MWNICILQFENSKFESWRSVQRGIKKHVKGADYGCDIGGPIHTIMFNLSISLATKKTNILDVFRLCCSFCRGLHEWPCRQTISPNWTKSCSVI